MSVLFARRVTLQVTAGNGGRKWTGGREGELDISFNISKTAGSEPNKAEIQIFNLSEDSRRLVSDSGASIRLSAGYPETESLIFAGDVDEVSVSRDGADIVTRVVCSDGGQALRGTVVNISSGKDTPVKDAVGGLVDQLGLPKGPITDAISGALKQGLSYLGPAKGALDELTSSNGLRWSVQDGAVQVHRPEGTSEAVLVLSRDSGLVGVPERFAQQEAQSGARRNGVKVISLLQPGLKPGRRIRVKSEWVSGDFVVEKVSIRGSTFGGEWYVELEAY